MILCMHINMLRSSEQSTKGRLIKRTRLYDYQTWQTHFSRNSRGAQSLWAFLLDCAFQMLIGWVSNNITPITWNNLFLLLFLLVAAVSDA